MAFTYQPSRWIPFRDMNVLEKVRRIRREEITRHPNPDYRIQVLSGGDMEFRFIIDIFERIRQSDVEDRRVVMILPQPWPLYSRVAYLLNKFRVNCRNLYTFNMDEYANERGEVAPESWEFGFTHALKKYFYSRIDPDLRPPEGQMVGLTNENLHDYGRRMEDLGGVDIVYSGPGWTGHLAFIEPDAPEFDVPLEEWKTLGPRIVTLSPFTLAQNSLHGSFGKSGDLAAVPPKAATVGPAQVIAARHRIQQHGITVHGTSTSWQRLISRLVMHGPVTPRVPESICQSLRTDVWVSEEIAADIQPDWKTGY